MSEDLGVVIHELGALRRQMTEMAERTDQRFDRLEARFDAHEDRERPMITEHAAMQAKISVATWVAIAILSIVLGTAGNYAVQRLLPLAIGAK